MRPAARSRPRGARRAKARNGAGRNRRRSAGQARAAFRLKGPPAGERRRSLQRSSIAVVLGFERACPLDAEIAGLSRAQRRQLDPELVEVQGGDLLVEVLGKHVDLVLVTPVVGPQLDLG